MPTVATVAGSGEYGCADGPAAVAMFSSPNDVAVASDGTRYVVDTGNHRVRAVAPDGTVTTIAGTGEEGGADDPGAAATFQDPWGITIGSDRALYVTEFWGHRVRRLARSAGGGWVVTTVVAADAGLKYPQGIAADGRGHLVIADG